MKKILGSIALATILLTATGCAPDPNDVCAHLEKVYKNYDDKPGYMRDRDACVEYYLRRKKQRGVNSYRREVECLQASTKMFDINRCGEKEDQRMK